MIDHRLKPVFVLAALLVVPFGLAEAGSSVPTICTAIEHRFTQSTFIRAGNDDATLASAACPTTTSPILAGECTNIKFLYLRQVNAPPAPTSIRLHVFRDANPSDHTGTGKEYFPHDTQVYGTDPGAWASQIEWCATSDGKRTGTPDNGPFRFVIRACDGSNQFGGCLPNDATQTYDMNNDRNEICDCNGNPGAYTVPSATFGYLEMLHRDDPPRVTGPSHALVGSTYTLTVESRDDYGNAITGAAGNITVLIQRPDGTLAFNGNPTEKMYPENAGGRTLVGHYYANVSLDQAGTWNATAYVITSTNKIRPHVMTFNVTTTAPATRADLDALEARFDASLADLRTSTRDEGNMTRSDHEVRMEWHRSEEKERLATHDTHATVQAVNTAAASTAPLERAPPGDLAIAAGAGAAATLLLSLLVRRAR